MIFCSHEQRQSAKKIQEIENIIGFEELKAGLEARACRKAENLPSLSSSSFGTSVIDIKLST